MKEVIISIILSIALASIAYIKKAMTTSALILALLFSFLICYFGGIKSYIILVVVFLGTVIGAKLSKKSDKEITETIEKSGKKDIYQIIANVGTGTITLILYNYFKEPYMLVIYASIMAESLADTLASDIGVLSKRNPINIVTLKKGEPGLSGNISTLGITSSFLGALIIAIIFNISNFKVSNLIIITISGFLGAIFDSILGSTIQVKYKCQKCSKITEKRIHCKESTTYYKGIKIINNDIVNLSSNIFAGLISYMICLMLT